MLPSNTWCSVNSQLGGISGDAPPLQRPGSACFDGPHDPPGQTTASFSALLLTSLSLCEGKIQSCILLNGKWCINGKQDGPLCLQQRHTDDHGYHFLFLRTVPKENMVRKTKYSTQPAPSVCNPDNNTSVTFSPAPSRITRAAAVSHVAFTSELVHTCFCRILKRRSYASNDPRRAAVENILSARTLCNSCQIVIQKSMFSYTQVP